MWPARRWLLAGLEGGGVLRGELAAPDQRQNGVGKSMVGEKQQHVEGLSRDPASSSLFSLGLQPSSSSPDHTKPCLAGGIYRKGPSCPPGVQHWEPSQVARGRLETEARVLLPRAPSTGLVWGG